jgi:hypothetical protein
VPYHEDLTTATRHLCAAAYLDEDFRDISLREVYYQARRMVAPSYGFDLVPVLGHCLKARNGAIVRDGALVVTVLLGACFAGTSLLVVLALMAWFQAIAGTLRLSRDAFRRLRGDTPAVGVALSSRAARLGLVWLLALVLSGVTADALGRSLTDAFLDDGYDGAAGQTAASLFLALLFAALIFAYPLAFSLWRQTELSRLTPGHPITAPSQTSRLGEIAQQQRGNTVVYGGYRPFVGSGFVVGRWGFAQRLVRPEPAPDGRRFSERQREFADPPFVARELIDYVRAHLATLLPQRAAEEQITGLTVEDKVFLAGTEVSELFPNTAPDVMARVIGHPTTPARHYLACQVVSWGGELVTTVYVHIAVQGRSLYLELTSTALPPCLDEYRVVDSVEGTGAVAWWRAVRDGLLETPRRIWRSPLSLTRSLVYVAIASGGAVRPSRLVRGYDYGARIGVRELGCRDDTRNLVQLQDVEKYQRLIERRVLASVLDFLDDRGIDTSEYRARAASVLNKVTNVYGGVANVDGTANYYGDVAGRDVTKGETA